MKRLLDYLFNKRKTKIVFNPVAPELLEEYNRHRPQGPKDKLCYAPFRNLYFGHHGKVVSCCYNRSHVLGIYPQMSIKEIWTGKNAQKLRNYINHNDLGLGCQSCNTLMQARNFDAIKSKMYDEAPDRKGFPSVMEFELNNTCNLECVMCSGDFSSSIRRNREKKPPFASPYDKGFIDQLEEFIPYLHETKFYGGEPFLIDIYYEIWNKIIELNPDCRISLQTNGTIFNNKVRDLLERGNFHVGISIDSLNKDNYERIRINASFEKVMDNIIQFHKYCKSRNTFFGISACMMRQNWFEAPDFINFCNKLETPVYFHSVFFPVSCALWNLDSEKLLGIYKELKKYTFPETGEVQMKNNIHYMDFVKQIHLWYLDALKREEEEKHIEVNRPEQLKEILNERIVAHIEHINDLSRIEKDAKAEKCLNKLDAIFKQMPQGEIPPKVLKKMLLFPVESLINGLEVESHDRLVEQLNVFIDENR